MIKKPVVAFLLSVLGAIVTPGVMASDSPFYVNVGAGGAFPTQNSAINYDSTYIFFAPTEPHGSDLNLLNVNWRNNYKTGFSGNIALGYQFRPCRRWEAEFLWQNMKRHVNGTFDLNELAASTGTLFNETNGLPLTPVSDRTNVFGLMANVYHDFNLNCDWAPFLGMGIGLARIHAHSTSANGKFITTPPGEFNTTPFVQYGPALYGYALGWQFKAGVGYELCDNMTISAQYRMFGTSHFQASDSTIITNPGTSVAGTFYVRGGDIRGLLVNAIELNFRYGFDM